MLAMNGCVAALPFGALIGDEAVAGTQWRTNSCVVVSHMTTPVSSTSGVAPIQLACGETYSGFRFYADDGLHYGWIRFRLGFPSGLIVPTQIGVGEIAGGGEPFVAAVPQSVDVLDWAYETVSGSPIQAAAVPSLIPLGVGAGSRAGNLRLVWAAESGKAYQLQFKDLLEGTFWQAPSLRIGATNTSEAAEVNIASASQFFRIVRAD